MRFSLRQMQIFREVARQLSYTRAAEILSLTQPATFAQVRQLEDHLGEKLIVRLGRTLYLTEAGKLVLQSAERMLDEVGNVETALTELGGLARGHLRLAVVSTAKYTIPAQIGAFISEYPGIDVTLTVGNRSELLDRFERNADDLYVLGTPPEGIGAESRAIAQNPLAVIAPADHPLSGHIGLTMADVANYPFVTRERGSGTRLAAERAFASAEALPQKIVELGANEAVKQGVIAGIGLSVLSKSTVSLELRHGYLVELDVDFFPIMRQWFAIWPEGKRLSRVAEAFLQLVVGKGNIGPRDL